MTAERAHLAPDRTGVLLINLGTPDAPTASAIRRYLRQFLSDRRVVELWRPLWLLLLYAFILPFRPRRLVQAYSKVWTAQGSPLLAFSERQRDALARVLGPDVEVALAMTYGEPSIPRALEQLDHAGARHLLVLPLYPQYSATTTAAALDAIFEVLRTRRWQPELRTITSYHDDAGYLDALALSVQTHWQERGRGDHLLMSFHSIPRQYLEAGDPYFCFCHKTARLLAERLHLVAGSWSVSFQSRLGRQPWLQPYTDFVLPQLAQNGVRNIDVICPGFSADCLETLEEVAIRYDAAFRAAGGTTLRYIPALNDSAPHIAALAALCQRHLEGWPASLRHAALIERVEAMRPTLDGPQLLP